MCGPVRRSFQKFYNPMIFRHNCWRFFITVFFLSLPALVHSHGVTISGVVLDNDNQTLPGVTISLNDGNFGTISDKNGVFVFKELPTAPYRLAASFVGYQTYTVTLEPVSHEFQITIRLEVMEYALDEVVISNSRRESMRRAESMSIDVVGGDFLNANRSGSLMQTLQTIPGVHSMNIGSGVSKPVIRGLGYYRVVFAQNGIKQSGQLWSSHTGLSIDQQSIHHLEIIKGPASLRFGSDAIGGVINTLPAHIPQQGAFGGQVSLTGKTNTRWLGASAGVSARRGNMYMHANITHNNFGDFKVPFTDVFILPAPVSSADASHEVELGDYVPNTAGRESAFSLTTGIVRPWGNSYVDFNFHSTKTGFFDWMGLQRQSTREEHGLSNRDIRIPYQEVDNYSLYHFTNVFFGENKLELALGYQYNVSGEHSPLFDRTGNRREDLAYFRDRDNLELELSLHTVSANVAYSLRSHDKQRIDFVLNTSWEGNLIDGYSHILPEYNRLSAGAGVIHQYSLSPEWVLNSGARVDLHWFEMKEALNPDPVFGDPVFNPDYSNVFRGTAFSLGLNYLPDRNTVLKAHIGKSYRIPSAYELGAYGLHRHEGRFERGDIHINPEQSWQLDLGLDKSWENLEISFSPFVNYFTNYLFLNPTPVLRPEGQVYEYQQTVALLYGGEISVDKTLSDRISLVAAAEYVYAVNLDKMMSLPFIPPLSVFSKARYRFNNTGLVNNSRFCVEGVWAGAQNFTVPNELNTPGYFLLNASFCTDLRIGRNQAELSLKVRNILDSKYYNHISFYRRMRIPEPGRDVQLFITVPF
jgi:iron complex outermembrane recepter protein